MSIVHDQNEREKALDITKSFIVQAPAGSGKTELLVNRYLKTLTTVKSPQNVIALTFTNKAVDELKSRIINSLCAANHERPLTQSQKLNYQLAQQVLTRSKKYNWNITKNLEVIQVITLDSLASKIVYSYNLENDFQKLNQLTDSADIYNKVAKELLRNLTTKESLTKKSIKYLLQYFDNKTTTFINLIAGMLKERGKWLLNLDEINLGYINKVIDNLISTKISEIEPLATKYLTDDFFNLTTIKFLRPLTIEHYTQIADLCLTKEGKLRKLSPNNYILSENKKLFINFIQQFPEIFVNKLYEITMLPTKIVDDFDIQHMQHIARALVTADFQLKKLFNDLACCDYTAISLKANEILSSDNVANVALYLDNSIDHILIDEFQDTSILQLNLITLIVKEWDLNSRKTLFLVGDPMQSIYFFRDAQVEIFLKVREKGIAHIDLVSIVLTTNFRSNSNIVKQNNDIFAKIFPNANSYELGQIKYEKAYSYNEDSERQCVFFYAFAKNEEHLERKKIIDIIKKNNEKSIAVLGMNRSTFKDLTKDLQAANIACNAYKNIRLEEDILIKDLLVICSIFFNKYDRLSWLSIMRSPYIGLSLDELLVVSKYDDIYNNLPNITIDKKERLVAVYKIFTYAFNNYGTFSFVEILNYVIDGLGINNFISAKQEQSMELFIEAVDKLEVVRNLSVENIKLALQELYVPHDGSGVNLMTIYQAKGLEFDIVILPNIQKANKRQNSKLLYINEFLDLGTLLAHKSDSGCGKKNYDFLQKNHKQRMHFELMRILYVAMTRAKSQLHISACADKKINSSSLLYLLKNNYANLLQDGDNNKSADSTTTIVNYKYNNKLSYTECQTKTIQKIKKINLLDGEYRALGIIIHYFLQQENFKPSVKDVAIQLNANCLSHNSINDYQWLIRDLLHKTQNCDDYKFLFKKRATTRVELEVISDNKVYVIDRVFIENNILYIIDFKIHFGENLNKESMEAYKKQLTTYAGVLKNIYNYQIKKAVFLVNSTRLIYV